MINIRSKRCLHDSCSKYPSFNVAGRKKAIFCKEHAENGMVCVRNQHCSHDACIRFPDWGVLTDGSASVCSHHKDDLSAGLVINFNARCEVAGCRKISKWGLDGKQPTHCPDHSRHKDGLVQTVAASYRKRQSRSSSDGAVQGAPFRLKTEVSF